MIKELIKNSPPFVIAVDGPSASGKGTLARSLAQNLGLRYLDTGKLYRAVAYKIKDMNIDFEDKNSIIDACLPYCKDISEDDVSNPNLTIEGVGNIASKIAAIPRIRSELLDFQREVAKSGNGAVLDGRDIGTIVCPDAQIKLFITANLENRTERRYKELQNKGFPVRYNEIKEELQKRDERDKNRQVAPLVMAPDAVSIDTTNFSADEVLNMALSIIEQRVRSQQVI